MNLPVLSPREQETLALVAKGLKDREIAEAMRIGITTVRSNIKIISIKYGSRNRAHSVSIGYQRGVLK